MQLSPSEHLDSFTRDHLPQQQHWPELVFDLPELAYPDQLNCAEELLEATIARHGPDRPCLRAGDGSVWTYEQLRDTANRIARVLTEDLGLVPGNRVLLRGPNNPMLVATWFGVLRAGGVVVTTMALLRAGELRTIAEICRPSIALCDTRFTDDLVKAEIDGLEITTYGGSGTDDLTQRMAGKPSDFDVVPTAADDVALLAFTSGTTGRPKATMHFHRDVLTIADTFSAHVLKPRPDDVFAGSPPLAFTFGLGGLVIFPLRAGASTLLLEKAAPPDLFGAVAAHGVTVLFTSPIAYRASLGLLTELDLSSLRRCVSAGEAMPKTTWEAFYAASGVKIIDGIGSTELLHIFIGSADDEIRPGSTGRPVPGYRARIVDDWGAPVPDGELGRLAVIGPTGCRYLADDRQQVYVVDGWNLTGDTYLRDSDGYFWYQARSDDMIISAGYNIAGPEVEEALLHHPDVLECGVIGVPDAERGTAVVTAYVVLRAGVAASAETVAVLQEHVKAEIAPYKYPRVIEFRDALPRTNTGKLQRFRLREEAAVDSSGAAAGA
ncbi:MAG TPA: AMP-binding protein [Actinomycetes bacterium]|nr:AMP-binding protein [Actinomycetes bacterium]